jgi:hypothetical protein
MKIGDMVHLIRNISSVGLILGINEVYQGFVRVKFISGEDAGKTYEVNSCEIIGVDDVIHEKEEEVKEEAPVQKPASTSKKKWSKVEVVAMIKEKPLAVERGVLCLNKHSDKIPEKSRSYVAYWAQYIASGKQLSGRHLFNARRTCFFNAKVLVDAANGVL